MTDFATRRKFMVDTQVRPADVTKFPIIDAMSSVPRELFVPRDLIEAAYAGDNITLDTGRVILDPRTLAKMLDAIAITQNDLVLDIGCGYGYSSAVMACMAAAVVGIEDNEEIVAEAQQVLANCDIDNVIIEKTALDRGAPDHGPYDVICIQGGVEYIPQTLLEQLKEGGQIVCIFMEGQLGTVRTGRISEGRVHWRYIFNASAPVLSGFAHEKEFVFQ